MDRTTPTAPSCPRPERGSSSAAVSTSACGVALGHGDVQVLRQVADGGEGGAAVPGAGRAGCCGMLVAVLGDLEVVTLGVRVQPETGGHIADHSPVFVAALFAVALFGLDGVDDSKNADEGDA